MLSRKCPLTVTRGFLQWLHLTTRVGNAGKCRLLVEHILAQNKIWLLLVKRKRKNFG